MGADIVEPEPGGPLLDASALERSRVRPRSRAGRLFGLADKDVVRAKQQLMAVIEEPSTVRSSLSSSHRTVAGGASAEDEATAGEQRADAADAPDTGSGPVLYDDPPPLRDATGRGYAGPTACIVAAITYRQLDHWARIGLVRPSLRADDASRERRLYSVPDLVLLRLVKRLLDGGASLSRSRAVLDDLRSRDVATWARWVVLIDGDTIRFLDDPDELVDIMERQPPEFSLALSTLVRQVEDDLADVLPDVVGPADQPHPGEAPPSAGRTERRAAGHGEPPPRQAG
ncbi:MerR family transcriptional regulator [Jiangella asiatica]|uniref:MerR family transcriptional regulator n=1 Tax=Jiangella asiatica TaxID=2530372 RepID=A0A4R5D6Y6_9ACTN|nr:MerR family transcriptional regulator [Jiangella asiatica]TDE08377.1 MerR family transcriptional regulator [Jiangella asiatica]